LLLPAFLFALCYNFLDGLLSRWKKVSQHFAPCFSSHFPLFSSVRLGVFCVLRICYLNSCHLKQRKKRRKVCHHLFLNKTHGNWIHVVALGCGGSANFCVIRGQIKSFFLRTPWIPHIAYTPRVPLARFTLRIRLVGAGEENAERGVFKPCQLNGSIHTNHSFPPAASGLPLHFSMAAFLFSHVLSFFSLFWGAAAWIYTSEIQENAQEKRRKTARQQHKVQEKRAALTNTLEVRGTHGITAKKLGYKLQRET